MLLFRLGFLFTLSSRFVPQVRVMNISDSSFEHKVTLFRSFMFVMEKWRKSFEMMYRIFVFDFNNFCV